MVKEKRILSYILGWLIVGYIICFIGINNVFASTYYMNYEYYQQYYDNFGSSVSAINTSWNESLQSYVSANITTTANSYGAGLSISSPIPILSNHTYTLSLYFEEKNNIALSSKNRIALSNSLSGASYNYANGDYWADMIQSNVNNNTILQFVFTAKGPASFIFIPFTTSYNTTQNYVVTQLTMEDLGSEGVSINEINSSLTNQTNTLNNSIQNSTNTITGAITDTENNINSNINDMEQSIVDSNKETQEVIKDQFNNCKIIDKNSILSDSYRLTGEGGMVENSSTGITDFISINSNMKLQITNNASGFVSCFYDKNKRYISCFQNGSIPLNTDIEIPDNASYFRATIYTSSGLPSFKLCSNKIDETNDKLDGIQGALTDSSAPNTSGLENSAGWLPAGPLDSILNLPLTMLNSLINSLGKTCSPLNLTLPYVNKNIQIPCLSAIFAQITGVNSLWTWVGTIASVLILYNYLLNLYAWVDRVLTLRAEFDEAMGADLANWGRL